MAINKEAIIKGVYAGMGEAAINPIPPNMWGYNKLVKSYPYNPQKAKEILKQEGFPNGFSSELFYLPVSRPYMPDGKKVAEAIQSDLKAVGVQVTLTTYEWAVYLDKVTRGDHSLALMGWTGDNGDPDNFLYLLLSGENVKPPAQNISFYSNAKVTQLLREAKVQTTQSKRAELYKQAQVMIHDDAPWVPLVHSKVAMPMDPHVHGFVLAPNGTRRFSQISLSK